MQSRGPRLVSRRSSRMSRQMSHGNDILSLALGGIMRTRYQIFFARFLLSLGLAMIVIPAHAGTLTWMCLNPNKAGPPFTTESACSSFAVSVLEVNACSYGAISCKAVANSKNLQCTTQSSNCSLNKSLIWDVISSKRPAGASSQVGTKPIVHRSGSGGGSGTSN